jgi:hypothetical protein
VKPRAFREHPAGENPLHLTRKLDLIHFYERCGVGRLRGRARVANPGRHLERPELHGLVHGDLEVRDASRHLVEGSENRDRILHRVGVDNGRAQCHSRGHCKDEAARGAETVGGPITPFDHAVNFLNRLPNSRSGGLVLLSVMALKNRCPQFRITLEHQTPLP